MAFSNIGIFTAPIFGAPEVFVYSPIIGPQPVLQERYGYNITWRPTFATTVQIPPSGREVGFYQQTLPYHEFELKFEILRDQTQNQSTLDFLSGYNEYSELLSLFISRGSQVGRFYFDWSFDNSREDQTIATAVASQRVFRAVRTLGIGTEIITENVGAINPHMPWTIYENGVPNTSSWTISPDFTSFVSNLPIAGGVVISADFYFYYFCRFITDEQEFEQFMYGRWTAPSLRFRSVPN